MKAPQTLGPLPRSFFEDHLPCRKGLQPTTVRNCRDAVVPYLQFVARERRCKLTRLRLGDLTCEGVLRFLHHLETQRGNTIATRNQRLAALRGWFEYAAGRRPEFLEEAQRLAGVPTKRTPPPRARFLHRDEVEALPSSGPFALRDRTLLLFLHNTGARVQEVARLRVENLVFGASPRVHLHGKGDKWRVCPLWTPTTDCLLELLGDRRTRADGPVFVSRAGRPLTRFGICKIVRRHAAAGREPGGEAVSPHTFRHYVGFRTMSRNGFSQATSN